MNAEQRERRLATQRECMRRLRERMTPEQLEADRKIKREHARQVRIERPEVPRAAQQRYEASHREERAFKNFCRYHDNPKAVRERLDAWKKANPERAREIKRESAKRSAARSASRLAIIRSERRRHIRTVKDKDALGCRVVASAEAAVPLLLPDHVRTGVVAMLIERVYSGDLPIRITAAHGKIALADYRRDVENFSLQHVALDAPAGENGSSLGQLMGVL